MIFTGRLIIISILGCLSLVANSQSYKKLHAKAIVVDTHNDILENSIPKGYSFDQDLKGKTHSDLNRFFEGGVDVQIFSVWCDGKEPAPYALANLQIDTLMAVISRNPGKMMLVTNPAELKNALKRKKLASLIGVEGGHMIENDMQKLETLYNRGTRYLTLTWNNSTSWATSAYDETRDTALRQPKGLNDFGKQLVKRMNELGMMVDLSHVGEQTFYDVIATTAKPVLVSHSSAYALCPVPRNLKDEQLKAVAKNGGVIHVNFYSGFLDSSYNRRKNDFIKSHKIETDSLKQAKMANYRIDLYLSEKYPKEAKELRAPLSLLIDHIDHIVKIAGIDHVGLGSDFDGIESPPQQLDGVENLPLVTKGLLDRGYSKKDIRKILGENFMRVFKANVP